jgi:hypothetical protein
MNGEGHPSSPRQPPAAVSLTRAHAATSCLSGEAGRRFGANRGWRQDDTWLSPYLKLYIMLFGIGPPATLPAVLGGYVGNPSGSRAWIETALQQGQSAGRWPSNVLKPSEAEGKLQNQFDALPLVGAWGLRPLELVSIA